MKLGKFKVAITGLLMIPYGEKRKGIVWIGKEPSSSLASALEGVLGIGTVVAADVAADDDVVAADDVAAIVGAATAIDV